MSFFETMVLGNFFVLYLGLSKIGKELEKLNDREEKKEKHHDNIR